MKKVVTIKIKKAGSLFGPFTISTEYGDIVATSVTKKTLIRGISYEVDTRVKMIILESTGKCKIKKVFPLEVFSIYEYSEDNYTRVSTACLWRHLTDVTKYNHYYDNIEPYIIEYPFAYQFNDEILQNVKDYTKAYKYFPLTEGVFTQNTRIETNDQWFNQAILYNVQQNSGLLELVPKPKNNLQAYNSFPKLKTDSKVITYTKSDNFYQYNTFWNVQKDSQLQAFLGSCSSLSIDKQLNQANMDYNQRSFKKQPLRAKDLKIRQILNNTSSIHLVSQFLLQNSQISYK